MDPLRTCGVLPIAALSVAFSAQLAGAQTLTGVGFGVLPGPEHQSYAYGMSDDGLTVTGYVLYNFGDMRPFRWTRIAGMQVIPTLAGGADSFAWTISGDGFTVAGSYLTSLGLRNAYRWTQAGGMTALETGAPPGGSSQCNKLSADGSVIVGYKDYFPGTIGMRAFRWTLAGGTQNLGVLAGDATSYGAAVSADGSVVVGYSSTASATAVHSFRWTAAQGMQDLGAPAGRPASVAQAVSSDGAFIAGTSGPSFPLSGDGAVAYLWSAAAGMRDIGLPPGAAYSGAYGVSSVGPVVVGFAHSGPSDRAMIWSAGLGPVYLDAYLGALGVDLTGWTLTMARSITPDGRTVVGWGVHNGHTEGWIATLPPPCGSADFNGDSDSATDADIEAFFACLAGSCCATCGSPDFNGDGMASTDADIEAFFRVLAGGPC
jgi:probable HAF family extracellular repeat protein